MGIHELNESGAMSIEGQHVEGASLISRWMTAYAPELTKHVERMLHSSDDADDVLQQVWIKAAGSPPLLSSGSSPRAWLYRVATNAALDRLALERRRSAALDGRETFVARDDEAPPDGDLFGLGEAARARIREQVAGLPRKQREAVWLRWVEGENYATIAAKLATTEEGARANVYQAMKRLRADLFPLWEKEYGP